MKNIYKISAVFFVGLSIIVSSCKKEDNTPAAINGCTDSSAMNYLSNATSNDGSCIFAYAIAQGVWNIASECEELIISIPLIGDFDVPLDSILPKTIEITGEGEGVVSMDINGEDVLADIATDGVITIQDNQTISFDANDFDPTIGALIGVIDVDITGSGAIVSDSNGNLSLALSFEILGTPQSSNCEITFSR
jgi:hypothetical protein